MKLLLDTDIGSDIDDAICLAYLLDAPHEVAFEVDAERFFTHFFARFA